MFLGPLSGTGRPDVGSLSRRRLPLRRGRFRPRRRWHDRCGRAPGWCSRRSSSAAASSPAATTHAEAASHVEDPVHLLVADAGPLVDQLEDRRHRQRRVDLVADLGGQPQQVLEAAGGDVGEPADVDRRSAAARRRAGRRSRSARGGRRRAAGRGGRPGPRRGAARRAPSAQACSRWSGPRSRAARSPGPRARPSSRRRSRRARQSRSRPRRRRSRGPGRRAGRARRRGSRPRPVRLRGRGRSPICSQTSGSARSIAM